MRTLLLALLLLPSLVLAQAQLMVSAVGDVRILVDGRDVGVQIRQGLVPVVVDQAGRHALRVESSSGVLLLEQTLELDEGESLAVHWNGERLEVKPTHELHRAASTSSTGGSGGSSGSTSASRQPSTMQAAQAGTTVVNILAPANPVAGTVSTGLAAFNAGATLVRTAQGAIDASSRQASGPPATSAHEDHSLESLQQSGFDPYAATGGRPSFDASLASVTFVAAHQTQALITIDSQPVATLGPDASEATVAVAPGMHRVMIFDTSGVELMYRGYLTVTAGWVLELRFSATEPPVSSLPEAWR